jgi:hypothetical protein
MGQMSARTCTFKGAALSSQHALRHRQARRGAFSQGPPVHSIDAATKDALKAVDRPLFADFWERFLACLDALRLKGQRTVYRLTLVKSYNMEEVCRRPPTPRARAQAHTHSLSCTISHQIIPRTHPPVRSQSTSSSSSAACPT